jgi:hypothetical protein
MGKKRVTMNRVREIIRLHEEMGPKQSEDCKGIEDFSPCGKPVHH